MEITYRKYNGSMAVTASAIILFAMMLLTITLQVWQCSSAVEQSKNNIERAVLAAASVNVGKLFQGVIESDGSVRTYISENWLVGYNISTDEVENYLSARLGMVNQSKKFIKFDSGQKIVYEITDLSVICGNEPLNFTAKFKLHVPIRFLDNEFFIHPNICLNCKYEPKF